LSGGALRLLRLLLLPLPLLLLLLNSTPGKPKPPHC
jgi:hypothetical protein